MSNLIILGQSYLFCDKPNYLETEPFGIYELNPRYLTRRPDFGVKRDRGARLARLSGFKELKLSQRNWNCRASIPGGACSGPNRSVAPFFSNGIRPAPEPRVMTVDRNDLPLLLYTWCSGAQAQLMDGVALRQLQFASPIRLKISDSQWIS